MNTIKRILDETKDSIPNNSRTAMAIRNGCDPESVASFAVRDGLQHLAASLFSALGIEEEADQKPLACVRSRLIDLYHDLPPNCQTAQLIAAGARLEDISEAAEDEGLFSIAAMLSEAEQEGKI